MIAAMNFSSMKDKKMVISESEDIDDEFCDDLGEGPMVGALHMNQQPVQVYLADTGPDVEQTTPATLLQGMKMKQQTLECKISPSQLEGMKFKEVGTQVDIKLLK